VRFRWWREKSSFVIWLIAGLTLASIPYANAAPELYYNTLKSESTGCVNKYDSPYMQSGRLIAQKNLRISALNVAIGTSNRANFNSTTYHIYTNDLTTNAPGTQLATFTPETITGSSGFTIARYVGNYSISSGTKFWIVPGQLPTVQSQCYLTSGGDVSEFRMNGVTPDSSTSNSNSQYWRAYSGSASPVGASWSGVQNFTLVVQLSIEAGQATAVTVSLSMQSGLQQTSYRTSSPLIASVDSPSRVTFYANGKIISGCKNILSSSGTATCNWKPSIRGGLRLYASAVPNDGLYLANSSSVLNVSVVPRTNKR
jgi:hypothetical protein